MCTLVPGPFLNFGTGNCDYFRHSNKYAVYGLRLILASRVYLFKCSCSEVVRKGSGNLLVYDDSPYNFIHHDQFENSFFAVFIGTTKITQFSWYSTKLQQFN